MPSDLKLSTTQNNIGIFDIIHMIKNNREFRNDLINEKNGIDFKKRFRFKKIYNGFK